MRSMETVGGGSVTFMSLLILFPDLSFNALVVGIRDYSTATVSYTHLTLPTILLV